MEFPFDPIVFKYEKDVTDDYETLYNSSFSSSLFPPGIFEYSPPSRPTSRSPSSRELRNEIGKITDLVDMNMRCWTKYSYQFYFHFLDEYRSNRLLTILLENNYYHTSLEPIIVCKQKIIENNTSQQFTSHPSDHQSQQSSFSPHFLSSPFDQSDSKNLQRSENRRISIKYSVYFCGIVRPLSSYYQLHACHSLPLSSSPREANVMNDLFHTQVTNIRSFITLLLSMTHELNELHSQGLCHSQLGMNSFLLYTPSTLDSTTRKEWGVQIMSHWLFLPSGPSDPSYTLHLPNSQAMVSFSFLNFLIV